MNIIFRLSPSFGRNPLKEYSKACEMMDLIDDLDPTSNSLLSKAINSVFKTLQEQTTKNSLDTTTIGVYMEGLVTTINKLTEESKTKVEVIKHGGYSLDWKTKKGREFLIQIMQGYRFWFNKEFYGVGE